MRILTINAGSSSVKFSLFDMQTGAQRVKVTLERVSDARAAFATIPERLEAAGEGAIDGVGHRVVHGGDDFAGPAVIDDAVVEAIERHGFMAPLHTPPILAGIRLARQIFPVPQVAVFDTAFHLDIPARAHSYAIPEAWRALGLRRYGFHGTSHHYVMERTAEALGQPAADLRIISCHLGNGASVCAMAGGKSVDTSMGMTALEGLVMGTRSGDVDPGLFHFLERRLGLTAGEIEDTLYHRSGLAALSGVGPDLRDIERAADAGDPRAALAIEVYAYRVRKYIGAYAAALGGVDAVTFTGGIGENSARMRARVLGELGFLGIRLDPERNAALVLEEGAAPEIQADGSPCRVLVTETREQWMIARQTAAALGA